jgi:hypothetical protein
MKRIFIVFILWVVVLIMQWCLKYIWYEPKIVGRINEKINVEKINIEDQEKFLNDLQLSPFWSVNKDNTSARLILRTWLENSDFSSWNWIVSDITVEIFFWKPKNISVRTGEELNIYDNGYFDETGVTNNSYSNLLLKLSNSNEIYLNIREQWSNVSRKKTFEILPKLIKEIKNIITLPYIYKTEDIYKDFYLSKFENLEKNFQIKRIEWLQDRDTFYWYFRTNSWVSYDWINIMISHDKYCGWECTKKSDRLWKSENIWKTYFNNDLVFFYIDDNAVYLSSYEYDELFWTFSWKWSFVADIEILNSENKVLYKWTDNFKWWER